MKTWMFFLILMAMVWSVTAGDYEIAFNQPGSEIYELNFTLNDYQVIQEVHDGQTFSNLHFSSSVFLEKKGYARLPYVSAAIQLPPDRNVDLQITASQYEEINLSNPFLPSRGVIYRCENPDTIPYVIDPGSVQDNWYPASQAETSRPFIIRDVRGVSVYFYPFIYNAEKNVLRVYRKLTVRLIENDQEPVNPLTHQPGNRLVETENLYGSVFMNYRASEDLHMAQYGDLLVITTARDETAIDSYIQWKREKGFNVTKEVVATGTLVKDLIQQKYNENPNLLYVQLVGDWEDIKSELGTSSNLPMDPDMGCVSGDDDFPDIAIGRLSAKSADDVTVQVNKIINYEKTPVTGNNWFITATGIASDQGPGDDNEYDYEHNDVIWNDKLDPFTFDYYNDIYDPSATKADVSTAVNNGTSLINYTGHGSSTSWSTSGFSNSDVQNLTNGEMLPWIISVACNNGEFNITSGDCFAEAWLKKDNGGAVMFLGSTISQPWDPPMRGQDYFMDVVIGGYNYDDHPGQSGLNTTEQRTTVGAIVVNGFNLMLSESNTSSDLETVQTWTTFGDPSMQVRTADPAPLSLSNETIRVGQTFTTTVTSNGQPVEGAMVAISQDGSYYNGVTDVNGDVSIDHDFSAGTALLVVTAFNCQTVYKEVDVISSDGPWIEVYSYSVDDTTTGNSNGQADYNESILLNVAAKNTGNETAYGVQGVLSSDDAYIQITDDSHTYGDMAPDQVVPGDDAFALDIADGVPDQHSALCRVTFSDDSSNNWTSDLELVINAPDLGTESLTVDDSQSGDGSGTLDAGETADLVILTFNQGHASAPGTVGELSSNSVYLTINNNTSDLGTLAPLDSVNAVFNVTASESTPEGTEIEVYYQATSGAYTTLDTFVIVVGSKPVYVMSDTTVYVDNGYFYDSGGQDGEYSNRESLTMTFYPADRSPAVKADFTSFVLSDLDELYIYDGVDRNAPQVSGSPFTGTNSPGEVTATNPDGALTFYFSSNLIGTEAGWSADIYSTVISDAEDAIRSKALTFELKGNYPNPFNPSTIIRYALAQSGPVQLTVFNVYGQKVRELVNGFQEKGAYRVTFDATGLSSGVYFCKLRAGTFEAVHKMLLIR